VCCVSGKGLCDELITRPENNYRLWRVVVRLRNLVNEEAIARVGLQCHIIIIIIIIMSTVKIVGRFTC
jgi:hypothetical protein